jgi:uncharacterized protein YjiS (DUF1127 family)
MQCIYQFGRFDHVNAMIKPERRRAMGAIDTILNSMRGQNLNRTRQAPVKTLPVWAIVWRWYCRCIEFNRSRRQLRDLTDYELADIGISREQAMTEADRFPRLRL